MQPKRVWAVYFSGTGTTEKTVRRIASGLAVFSIGQSIL